MLWQTGTNPYAYPDTCIKEIPQRERERGRWERWTARMQKKRVFLRLAAELWWAMGATRLCPSSSWFLILLAEMLLQPPSACLRHTAHCLLAASALQLGPACRRHCRSCIRLMGQNTLEITLDTWVYAESVAEHTEVETKGFRVDGCLGSAVQHAKGVMFWLYVQWWWWKVTQVQCWGTGALFEYVHVMLLYILYSNISYLTSY